MPTVFVSGGPMMPGHLPGRDETNPYAGRNLSLTDMFEAVGAVASGRITEEQLREMEMTAPDDQTRRSIQRLISDLER